MILNGSFAPFTSHFRKPRLARAHEAALRMRIAMAAVKPDERSVENFTRSSDPSALIRYEAAATSAVRA